MGVVMAAPLEPMTNPDVDAAIRRAFETLKSVEDHFVCLATHRIGCDCTDERLSVRVNAIDEARATLETVTGVKRV